MSLEDFGQHMDDDSCVWCVGGMSPVGFHPDLGPVARLCPTRRWCTRCGDTAVFLVEYETLDDRIDEMLGDGLTTVVCEHCNGVLDVVPVTPTTEASDETA